jgi:hypothetical protein
VIGRSVVAVLVAVAGAFSAPAALDAQRGRGRGATGEKPKSEIIQTVGCATRAADGQTWSLTRAAEPRPASAGLFTSVQVDQAKAAPLGEGTFQLIGVADFLDTEALLRSGQRKEFTTPENANATNQLRHGHKVLVKGMHITAATPPRINLLNVVSLAETCG